MGRALFHGPDSQSHRSQGFLRGRNTNSRTAPFSRHFYWQVNIFRMFGGTCGRFQHRARSLMFPPTRLKSGTVGERGVAGSVKLHPTVRWPLLLIVALGVVALIGWAAMAPPPIAFAPERRATSGAPRTYAAALARINAIVAGSEERVRTDGEEWLVQEKLAHDLIERARLTGSFDDYAGARAALAHGFSTVPKGSGPHFTQAALDFGMHRLAAAETMLAAIDRYAVAPEPEVRTEMAAMRADIAFYRGDLGAARRAYAATREPFRMAVLLSRTGKPDEAFAEIDRMERGLTFPTAHQLANLALMRGGIELRRGSWDKASAHFARADAIFPGFWLAQAHVAQMRALSGDRAGAARNLIAIARRSNSPEVMDLLASVLRAEGDYPGSRTWAARAGALWQARLSLFPEAAWGHAVEHELAYGDPARALTMARSDWVARPHGATGVALGWAMLATNDPAGALRMARTVDARGWVSAEQHLLAAQALARLGQGDAARTEEQKALAIDPHARDAAAGLVWFGH